MHGLIFTLGVVLSFWILVGILLGLRESIGEDLGWGFQLQEPVFVFGLAVFLLIFALSLSGVFEIGMSLTGVGSQFSQKTGYAGSFFSGFLATIVATPCMAPFLGAAVGAALAMPWISALVVFTFIALGLSFPYLLLSIFPKWISRLPKPGGMDEHIQGGHGLSTLCNRSLVALDFKQSDLGFTEPLHPARRCGSVWPVPWGEQRPFRLRFFPSWRPLRWYQSLCRKDHREPPLQ